jgi:hypothetical protein
MANAVFFGKCAVPNALFLGIFSPDLANLFFSKLGGWRTCSPKRIGATFPYCVEAVFLGCAEVQMQGVYAPTIITIMHDDFVGGDRPVS